MDHEIKLESCRTLYHLQGIAANSYVTVLPAGAVVESVAWGIASLPTGAAYADWTDSRSATGR